MMVFFTVVTILAVATLFWILYVFLHKLNGRSQKPVRRKSAWPPIEDTSVHANDERIADHASVVPIGYPEIATHRLQVCLTKGMAQAFSLEGLPTENKASLLRLDDVSSEVRKKVLSHITALRNFDTLHELQKMMSDPQSAMTSLSRMITGDPMLAAKILRMANSPYYGMQQKLNSISHAIMIIGLANLRSIIYNESLLNALNERRLSRDPVMQSLLQHATYTTICASYLAHLFKGLNPGTLFTLGLLHDIGKFLMVKLPPLLQTDMTTVRTYSPYWTMEDEEGIYGINHALVGRLALQYWGLSELMVETVTLHHSPGCLHRDQLRLDDEGLQYLLVLFLADHAACLIACESDGGAVGRDLPIDRLHPSYHDLIDQKKLRQLLLDQSLLGQIREAGAIAETYMKTN